MYLLASLPKVSHHINPTTVFGDKLSSTIRFRTCIIIRNCYTVMKNKNFI